MEKFLRFVKGYVSITVTGEQCERFLNLCRSRGIVIHKLKTTSGEELKGLVSIEDFKKLRPVRSKTGVHIRVTQKNGLPFFFFRNKKRKAFFVGIGLCLVLMVICSTRIWNIHLEGNIAYSTPEILAFLEEEGIVHGMPQKRVHCAEIAAKVREAYPKIAWVSARIDGTRLILTVKEGKGLDEKKEAETEKVLAEEPCNLTSEIDGTIVKIITRAGVPLFRPGDTCKKGDLLVLGRLDLKNDSQEVVRYEYVHADADVYVAHKLSYYYEFPMEYKKTIPEGTSKKGFYIKLGNWQLGTKNKQRTGWRRTVEEIPLKLTENFFLPVSLGKIHMEKLLTVKAVYTEEEAKAIAGERLRLHQEKLIQKGVQISQNNVKIEINHDTCVTRGTFDVIQKTGAETPVEYMEQPIERTTEDG